MLKVFKINSFVVIRLNIELQFLRVVPTTKHKAVLATKYQPTYTYNNQLSSRKKFVVFDLRDSNIGTLHYCLNNSSWNNVYDCTDINVKFQNLVETLLIIMSPHQHLITQFFTDRVLFLMPNEQCQSTEGRQMTVDR